MTLKIQCSVLVGLVSVVTITLAIDVIAPSKRIPTSTSPPPTPSTSCCTALRTKVELIEKEVNKVEPQLQLMVNELQRKDGELRNIQTDLQTLQSKVNKFNNLELELVKLQLKVDHQNLDIKQLQGQIQDQAVLKKKQTDLEKEQANQMTLLMGISKLINDHSNKISNLERSLAYRVKQFAWNEATDMDHGTIKVIEYNKLSAETGLRLTYAGNLCIHDQNVKAVCARWFFTINGHECINPQPLDAVRYSYKDHDKTLSQYMPAYFGGICNGVPRGRIRIELKVDTCDSKWGTLANSCTGSGNMASRIIVEEVPYF